MFANLTADFLASLVLMPAVPLWRWRDGWASPALLTGRLVAGWAARAIVSLAHLFAQAPARPSPSPARRPWR